MRNVLKTSLNNYDGDKERPDDDDMDRKVIAQKDNQR